MDTSTNRAKAYSYLRFSTPDQMHGDSFRRQTDAAHKYAEHNGLDLDTELTFRDLGVSAFRGANAVEGALGQFVAAVDSGKVEPGSYLLVENLDRLSRDKIMPALNRFSSLLEKGITVITLSDGRTYDADSLNNLPDLMMSLMVMSRAHEESDMKSKRLRSAWKNKKAKAADGHIVTARAPAWLYVESGAFEAIEDRAAIVRRIFDLSLKGWGKAAIARQFNEEDLPTFGRANGWHASYIQKILRNEAVIGRFQPMKNTYEEGRKRRVEDGEPVENYFPAIISDSDFYKVKHSKPGPSGKGKALPRNVLSGLVFCGRCRGPMHYVNKGKPRKVRRQQFETLSKVTPEALAALTPDETYLACDNSRRKKSCDAKSVRYQPVLNHVLENLSEYRNMYELSVHSEQETGAELDTVSAEISKTEDTINRLLDTLERVPSASAEKRLAKHEERLASLRAQRVELEEKRVIQPTNDESLDDYLAWYYQEIAPNQIGEVAYAAIAHLSAEIKRSVEKVILEKDKPIRVIAKSA